MSVPYTFTPGTVISSAEMNANFAAFTDPSGSATVGFVQAGTGAETRTAQDKLRETVSVKDFGAVGDGVADDTASINAAIAAVAALGGGVVHFPEGNYKVTATIVVTANGITLSGSGKQATFIVASFGAADILAFGNGVNAVFYGGVRDMTVRSSVATPTSGAAIHFNKANAIDCRDVRVRDCYNGFAWSTNSGVCRTFNCNIENYVGTAQLVADATDFWIEGTYCYGLRDDGVTRSGRGLVLLNVNGGRAQQSSYGLTEIGVLVQPAAGQSVINVFFDQVEADLNSLSCLYLDAVSTGTATRLQFDGFRAGFSGGNGVDILSNNVQGVTFNGGKSERSIGHGVNITAGKRLSFNDFGSVGNNWFNDGVNSLTYNGYAIFGGDDIDIIGGRAGGYPDVGPTGSSPVCQFIGIAIFGSFAGALRVLSVNCLGNKAAALVNSSTSAGVRIADVSGYNPVGPSAVVVGASPFTYTAGATREALFIRGGTVSDVSVAGTTVFAATGCTVQLEPAQSCVVTYSVAPTIVRNVG